MPEEYEFDPWSTSSGLPDKITVKITGAEFTYNAQINDGKTTVCQLTGSVIEGAENPEFDQWFSCGNGWEPRDKGMTLNPENGKPKPINESTAYAHLFKSLARAAEQQGMMNALRDKGNPFGAGLWEGLTLFFEREPYIFKDRETGKDVERSRLVVGKVVDGLGSGASSAPAAQPTAEPAPSSPTAESASSNGDGELTPALRLALTKAAKAADSYNAFVEAAFAVPGVVDNAAAEQVVLDEGFYAQARA